MPTQNEKPIIFSADMVRAILNGSKSQTRRVIKPQPTHIYCSYSGRYHFDGKMANCPYGQAGDRLWVKETWRLECEAKSPESNTPVHIFYKADGGSKEVRLTDLVYNEAGIYLPSIHNALSDGAWQSSRFMSRWASRVQRIITLIRAERLLDISEADAKAEGFNSVKEFLTYWDILNKKRGYGTDVNPWNWVIGW